jgi:hypothetical protein
MVKRHTPLVLLLVVAMILSSVPLAAAAENQVIGRPGLSLSVQNNQVAPGEATTLRVFLVNDGVLIRGGPERFTARVTTARATTLDIGDLPGLDIETDSIAAGQVPEGVVGPLEIDITVPEGVPAGRYSLPVTVSYTYTGIVGYDETEPNDNPRFSDRSVTTRLSVPVVVESQARFRVVGVRTDAQIGDNGTVVAAVQNVGTSPARDASVRLTSANEDLNLGGARTAESFVDSWAPGEVKDVTFPVAVVADAELREYTLTGAGTYTDTDGLVRTSNELRTSVRPRAEQTFALSGVESTLRVNYEGTVSGRVTNDGPAAVRDAVVVIQPTSPNFDASETEFAIPDLAVGESADFSFDVEVSSAGDPGSRQLSFVVRYENDDGNARTSDPLATRIDVGAERDPFAVDLRESTISAGGEGRLTVVVTNAEDETLSDISAKLFVDDPISSSDDEAFIDALDPGESAEITFQVSTGGSTFAKAYPVSVDFEYDRADGTTQVSDSFRLPVTVEASSGGGLPIGLLVGVGAVVLVGAAIVVVRRR